MLVGHVGVAAVNEVGFGLVVADADDIFAEDDQREDLEKLIEDAKKLTKHRLWKLR